MAEYQLTATDDAVIRTIDLARVPNDPNNLDWQAYEVWLADGGVPDPYVPPEPPTPSPDPGQVLLFNHENRIRELEGQPPLILEEFRTMLKGT